MSAIFGILRFDCAEISARDLERMGNTLAHRGPDGRKFVVDGAVGLGHCLMRVNQEDMFEAQPLRDREAGLTLVADCRIDNREELANAFGIAAAELRDMPDSALVMGAYKKWGEDCAEHLLGDFAFAVWDGRAKKLVLARDHMGQRNVFYHKGENFFVFASEIKALWAIPDVPRILLDEAIGRYLLIRGNERGQGGTLYTGISGVLGGAILAAGSDGAVATRRYWEPRPDPRHENRDEAYYIKNYRNILAEAVTCRLRRLNRPAALMLSGGFDSAAIAGLSGPTMVAQRRKLITFSRVVSEAYRGTKSDIRPWVEACHRVMPHLDVRYLSQGSEGPLDKLERRCRANDGPATSNFNHRMFSDAAASGARLIMDGHGGDYTVNPRGYGALAWLLRTGQVGRFFAELKPHMRLTGHSFRQVVKGDLIMMLLPPWLRHWGHWLQHRGAQFPTGYAIQRDFQERLLRAGAIATERGGHAIPRTAMRAHIEYFAKRASWATTAGLDVTAAAYGIDLTHPFHDKRVVEFGLAIPEDLYVKNGRNRYLACAALRDLYPPELQTRRRENDEITPDYSAMLAAATPSLLAEADRMAENSKLSAYIDFKSVRRLLSIAGPEQDTKHLMKKSLALRALIAARFVEWFEGGNRR